MTAVDTNILVYAHRGDSSFHKSAESIIKRLAEGGAQWAIPWPCLYEFVAIVTHPRIYDPPTPLEHALLQVEAWLESPTLALLGETETGFWRNFRNLAASSKISGPKIHDARIAALCIDHGVDVLLTADRDFSRFKKLAVKNPL